MDNNKKIDNYKQIMAHLNSVVGIAFKGEIPPYELIGIIEVFKSDVLNNLKTKES